MMAGAIWLIVLVSVAFFFKWGLPTLESNRGGLDHLFYAILGITGAAYIIVQTMLGFFIWKYSDRPGAEGVYWHDNHKMEVGWTVGTAAVLIPIVMIGLRLWNGVFSPPPPDAVQVEVVGAQFQWDMRYPGPDGVLGRVRPELISLENPLGIDPADPASADDFSLTNQLVLPVDRPALIHLRSKDMQHSFFLPQHRVKQDLVPGMDIQIWFIPTNVGEFEIACAELCGLGHYRMRGFFTVMEQSAFEDWLVEQEQQHQQQMAGDR
jgi:cytochrome c oxidase subunit II